MKVTNNLRAKFEAGRIHRSGCVKFTRLKEN
jgi:hypothetical protein